MNPLAGLLKSPLARNLRSELEAAGELSLHNIHPAASAGLAALVRAQFPERPILLVADGLVWTGETA